MKEIFGSLLIALASCAAGAQSASSQVLETERARLASERAVLEQRFEKEQAACYQKFVVESCLEASRHRSRAVSDDLNRQGAALNDSERKERAAAELRKLEENKASVTRDAAPREPSRQSQQNRGRDTAAHPARQADVAGEAAAREAAFAEKQRAHAQEQAKAARLRAEAPGERERYERKQKDAAEHRAEVERNAANRTKPRAAPLPNPL